MISFPNCKINLGLRVVGKRKDGYHNLETVFYPVLVKDVLEVVQGDQTSFQLSGLPVPGNIHDNLCLRAYYLLKKDLPQIPFVNIYLYKTIPLGAGLGGGSADGAFMLKMLNRKFSLNISAEVLVKYALQLGSDCPFFINNTPSFATGRGEELTTIGLDLIKYKIVLVNPGIHVSTKEAFLNLSPAPPVKSIRQTIAQPMASWKAELINDFENNVFQLYPEIETIKKRLYESGAIYASMTGSGSTVFGIFEALKPSELSFPQHYTVLTPALL